MKELMGTLISLLIFVLVAGLIFFVIQQIPLPQPWRNIANIIFAIIILLWLLSYLGVLPTFLR